MKALWAYEPFHQDEKRTKGMHNLLKQLVDAPVNIEVGFVYDPSGPLSIKDAIKDSLKKSKISIDDKKIHVLHYETRSNTKAVDQLLHLAKARNAKVLALYTHSRRGFKRLVLGSFAETTIHRSPMTLLLANPKISFPKKIKKIFFMDDFSPASKKHLKQVVQLCKKMKAKLTVFHAAEIIYKWSLNESDPKIHAYRRKVASTRLRIEQECRKAKVKVDVKINSEMMSVTDCALKDAKDSKSDLIVVAAKSGAMATLMGGSITRQIVRESEKPVLILK